MVLGTRFRPFYAIIMQLSYDGVYPVNVGSLIAVYAKKKNLYIVVEPRNVIFILLLAANICKLPFSSTLIT